MFSAASSLAGTLQEPPLKTSETYSLEQPNIYVELTHKALDIKHSMDRVKSPQAGAIVLFAGTKSKVISTTLKL